MTTPTHILCDTCGVIYRHDERHDCFRRGTAAKGSIVTKVFTIIVLGLSFVVVILIYIAAFQAAR